MFYIWLGSVISKLLSLDAEARAKLFYIKIRSILHAYLWIDLILDVVPILALYLPVVIWGLADVILLELSTDIHELCESMALWVLMERL